MVLFWLDDYNEGKLIIILNLYDGSGLIVIGSVTVSSCYEANLALFVLLFVIEVSRFSSNRSVFIHYSKWTNSEICVAVNGFVNAN